MITQFQILLGDLLGAIEAVDHTAKLSDRVPSEDPQSVLMSIPDMEDHRLFQFPGKIQLIEEPDMLHHPVLFLTLIMIVQTAFTKGDHSGSFRKGIQFVAVCPFLINGTGRVNAHSGENSSVAFGTKLQNLLTGLQTQTRFNRVGDTRVLQFLEQLLPVAFLEGISIFAMSQIPEVFLIALLL